jgi:hypothetical protein
MIHSLVLQRAEFALRADMERLQFAVQWLHWEFVDSWVRLAVRLSDGEAPGLDWVGDILDRHNERHLQLMPMFELLRFCRRAYAPTEQDEREMRLEQFQGRLTAVLAPLAGEQ